MMRSAMGTCPLSHVQCEVIGFLTTCGTELRRRMK
ncbi:MAG: hypothetical protein BAJALOKI1v1_360025, partial [Promethearchaeota archaeon]